MQYTASSFAWPLIQSFRSMLWPHRVAVTPVGPFPARAELTTHTPDMAEHDIYAPLLMGVGRVFRMIRNVSWTGEPAFGTAPITIDGRVGPLRALTTGVLAALRRGRIHVGLAFIVLTLLVVFFIEALSTLGPAVDATTPAASAVEGDSK
jgi:hypothetical protein